jgi:predicted transposase YbfD/YdcC
MELEWLENREAWEGLKAIAQYRTFRREKGKETVQTDRHYISSGDFTAEEFLKYIGGRWSTENQSHWMQNTSVSGRRAPGEDGERDA